MQFKAGSQMSTLTRQYCHLQRSINVPNDLTKLCPPFPTHYHTQVRHITMEMPWPYREQLAKITQYIHRVLFLIILLIRLEQLVESIIPQTAKTRYQLDVYNTQSQLYGHKKWIHKLHWLFCHVHVVLVCTCSS